MGIVRIPLRDGKTLILDDEDVGRFAGRGFVLHRPSLLYPDACYARVLVAPRRPAYVHRLVIGAKRGDIVDHIDGNGLNDTRANLRIVPQSNNMQKVARRRSTNTSGYTGVFYDRNCRKWRASASVGDRTKYLGVYVTAEEAARVYDAFVRRIHGPLAFVNFPEES